jgi:Amt family ammonium transporter
MGIAVNGFLAGLLAVTCPCYSVNQLGAVIIGTVAGVLVVLGIDLLEHFRIVDPIGAWPVHGLCGMWGTWSLGLFATGQYFLPGPNGADTSSAVTGLFYGGGVSQLWSQVFGNLLWSLPWWSSAGR